MRYVFYFNKGHYEYMLPTRNLPLQDLFEFLRSRKQECWVEAEEDAKDPLKIIIWSTYNIKKNMHEKTWSTSNTQKNVTPEDQSSTEEPSINDEKSAEYSQYAMKRFAEMPAIRISRDNYKALAQQWKTLYKRKPKYLIFREHDTGYIDIIEKDELSKEDIAIMLREYKIYQNYTKRRKEYIKTYPRRNSRGWCSPVDNEFESDFALYDPVDEQGVE